MSFGAVSEVLLPSGGRSTPRTSALSAKWGKGMKLEKVENFAGGEGSEISHAAEGAGERANKMLESALQGENDKGWLRRRSDEKALDMEKGTVALERRFAVEEARDKEKALIKQELKGAKSMAGNIKNEPQGRGAHQGGEAPDARRRLLPASRADDEEAPRGRRRPRRRSTRRSPRRVKARRDGQAGKSFDETHEMTVKDGQLSVENPLEKRKAEEEKKVLRSSPRRRRCVSSARRPRPTRRSGRTRARATRPPWPRPRTSTTSCRRSSRTTRPSSRTRRASRRRTGSSSSTTTSTSSPRKSSSARTLEEVGVGEERGVQEGRHRRVGEGVRPRGGAAGEARAARRDPARERQGADQGSLQEVGGRGPRAHESGWRRRRRRGEEIAKENGSEGGEKFEDRGAVGEDQRVRPRGDRVHGVGGQRDAR